MIRCTTFRLSILMLFLPVCAISSQAGTSHPTGWGNNFAAEMARGDSCLGAREYARALEAYEHAERLTPHASVAPLRIALTLYRWGNAVPALRSDLWPGAIKAADRSRFLDPTGADAVFLSAVVRYRLGDYKSAVDVYKALEMVRQGDIDLYLDLAVVASRAGDQALATRALEKARTLNPSSKRLYTVAKEVFAGR